MIFRAAADTHALIWSAMSDPRMSVAGDKIIDEATLLGEKIAVSSISLVEIVYLLEKKRIHPDSLKRILELMNLPNATVVEIKVDRDIAMAMAQVPRSQVKDMPDRIIAATAIHLNIPLISRDRKIRSSNVTTIW